MELFRGKIYQLDATHKAMAAKYAPSMQSPLHLY